jgi:predicted esterase YcpF (UPF0227 family)
MRPPKLDNVTMRTTHLLYLHGFRSSPQSAKAQLVARWVAVYNAQAQANQQAPITWACPQLPPSPSDAMALMADLTAQWPTDRMAIIGSSLGGYYATALMKRRGCRAWLINPAVAPARELAAYMRQPNPQHPPEENHFFNPTFVDALQAINPHPVGNWLRALPNQAARLGVLIAKGDEVLDWRDMHAAYSGIPGVHIRLTEGGNHTVSDFDQYLPEVLQFLGY